MRKPWKTYRWLPFLLVAACGLAQAQIPPAVGTCPKDLCTMKPEELPQVDLCNLLQCRQDLQTKPALCAGNHNQILTNVKNELSARRILACTSNFDALLQTDVCPLIQFANELRTDPSTCQNDDPKHVLYLVEKTLRKKGDLLEESIAAKNKAKTAAKKMNQDPSTDTDSEEQELAAIKATVNFSEQGLVVGAEKYDDYFFRLNTGYEFVAIDKFFDKGEPRVALLVNRRVFGGERVTDDVYGWHPFTYGGRMAFAATLESSAEATVQLPDQNTQQTPQPPVGMATAADTNPGSGSNSGSDSTNAKVTKTFNFELQTSWIFYRSLPFTPNKLRDYLGFIVVAGGLKTDDQPKITSRFYSGFRLAINPEFYADFMYGHTSGLRSDRLEVRGQFPVMSLANGDRIFMGGIGNFAINKRRREPPTDAQGNVILPIPRESDVVRAYITWNTDFKNLFNNGKGQS